MEFFRSLKKLSSVESELEFLGVALCGWRKISRGEILSPASVCLLHNSGSAVAAGGHESDCCLISHLFQEGKELQFSILSINNFPNSLSLSSLFLFSVRLRFCQPARHHQSSFLSSLQRLDGWNSYALCVGSGGAAPSKSMLLILKSRYDFMKDAQLTRH
jgi:hypothetical protein